MTGFRQGDHPRCREQRGQSLRLTSGGVHIHLAPHNRHRTAEGSDPRLEHGRVGSGIRVVGAQARGSVDQRLAGQLFLFGTPCTEGQSLSLERPRVSVVRSDSGRKSWFGLPTVQDGLDTLRIRVNADGTDGRRDQNEATNPLRVLGEVKQRSRRTSRVSQNVHGFYVQVLSRGLDQAGGLGHLDSRQLKDSQGPVLGKAGRVP